MSEGYHGYGILLQVDWNADGQYENIGCLVDIDTPGISVTMAETTCLSQDLVWKEFIAGFIDGGEVNFTVRWKPSVYEALVEHMGAGLGPYLWKIIYPDAAGSDDLFYAHVQNVQNHVPEDGVIDTEVTLKVTGAVTFTNRS